MTSAECATSSASLLGHKLLTGFDELRPFFYALASIDMTASDGSIASTSSVER